MNRGWNQWKWNCLSLPVRVKTLLEFGIKKRRRDDSSRVRRNQIKVKHIRCCKFQAILRFKLSVCTSCVSPHNKLLTYNTHVSPNFPKTFQSKGSHFQPSTFVEPIATGDRRKGHANLCCCRFLCQVPSDFFNEIPMEKRMAEVHIR